MRSSPHLFILCFLPLVVTLYQLLPARNALRNLFLTFCGLAFYAWWNPWLMLLVLGTTAVDYNLGRLIFSAGDNHHRKRLGVALSAASNLALLAFFKYFAFAADSERGIANWAAWAQVPAPEFFRTIVLPVGLSFLVFQSLGYCIDLYRGRTSPAGSYLDFVCFVSLFPHLVAGPLARHGILAGQMRNRAHPIEGFALGLTRFGFGLSKHVLVAGPMGAIADRAFGAGAGSLTPATAWMGLFAYAFQVYFNFSALSDIAIGLARTMGLELGENFASPYKSASITGFWRRWHMSLSTLLRDHLYVPLGGNRKGSVRACVNLILCMLIAGLWHGAQWTFVIWGAIHGGMLAIERSMGKRPAREQMPHGLRVAITFFVVLVSWVFFRSESVGAATRYLGAMFGGGAILPPALLLQAELGTGFNVLMLVITALVVWFGPNTQTILHRFTLWKALLGLILFAAAVAVMFATGRSPSPHSQF